MKAPAKNLDRRIRKHVHAQLHTVECLIPPGFTDLALRFGERILSRQLASADVQGAPQIKIHRGHVRFEAVSMDQLHTLLLEGVLFTEVKIRLMRSRCSSEEKLTQILSEFEWDLWLPAKNLEWDIRVDSTHSQLYHEGKIKRIFLETMKTVWPYSERSKQDPLRIGIDVNLEREVLEIFLSVGGRDYWKLGQKQTFQHAAPLREDIAACLVERLSELSRESFKTPEPTYVLNPFCGTGTLLHAVALHTAQCGRILSSTSDWLYTELPFFRKQAFEHLLKKKTTDLRSRRDSLNLLPIRFSGEDIDNRLCTAARTWFEQQKISEFIHAQAEVSNQNSCDDQLSLDVNRHDKTVWILANPPFGQRLSNDFQGGTEKLYESFGNRLNKNFSQFKKHSVSACAVVLCPDEATWRILSRELKGLQQICEHLTLGGLDIRALYLLSGNRE